MNEPKPAVSKIRRHYPVISIVSDDFIHLARILEALEMFFPSHKLHSSWRWRPFAEHAAAVMHDVVVICSDNTESSDEIRARLAQAAALCPEAKTIHYAAHQPATGTEDGYLIYPAHEALARMIKAYLLPTA